MASDDEAAVAAAVTARARTASLTAAPIVIASSPPPAAASPLQPPLLPADDVPAAASADAQDSALDIEATAAAAAPSSPPTAAPDTSAKAPTPRARAKRKADAEPEDEEEDDDDDDEDDEDDEEDDDDEDDDDDDDDDEEAEEEAAEDAPDEAIREANDGLDLSNIIETRPRRKAAAAVTDYTSEEAIRKAGVAPDDAAGAAANEEELDASYMDTDDDGDPGESTDKNGVAKPPPKKKRKPQHSPSPEPGPKPPPARPTVRIKMITTQGAGSAANPVAPGPIGEEDDPDLYIMEIPHIMLEQLRAVQHPWATWVEETQKAAQDAQRAEKEKEEADRKEEEDRRRYNAAAAALQAAKPDAAAPGAADGGPSAPPAPGAVPPGMDSDLPPHLAALLARHQEKPIAKKRTRKKEAYDVNDPFVDDSELTIDEPTHFVEPKNTGYYVCIGDVEVFRTTQQKVRRRRRVAGATGAGEQDKKGAAGGAAAAGANGSAHAAGTAAGTGTATAAATAKARQSAIASSAKATGAAGAMDMLLAMRAKQTGLTVSEHVVAGVQRPGTEAAPPAPARTSASPAVTDGAVPMEGVQQLTGDSSRRKSEGSRLEPIPVDDSDEDESKARAAAAASATAGPGAESNGLRRTARDKSPVKAVVDAAAAGLRRTPRRSASAAEVIRSASLAKEAGTNGVTNAVPVPDASGSATPAAGDISMSIQASVAGDTSTTLPTAPGNDSTAAAGTAAGAPATTAAGASGVQANGKKNRYPCLPVHPKLAQAFEELKVVVAKEPFEVKTKFPAYLKPPLVRTAKLALELGEYNDNFFNWLPTIFPYNRFTMMKLTKREFFDEHTAYYKALQDENLDALKGLVEASMPLQKQEYEAALKKWNESGGPDAAKSGTSAGGAAQPAQAAAGAAGDKSSPLTPAGPVLVAGGADAADDEDGPEGGKADAANGEPAKRWRWDEDMRAHLHTCVTAENAMVELHNEKQQLESANKTLSELNKRKALYKRIAGFWSEDGWVNTSLISREYTRTKNRYERQAARAAEEAEVL